MCKVNRSIQCFSYFLMCSKLLPVITGDRMNRVTRKQSDHSFFYRIFGSVFHQTHSQKAALPLHQCHNRSLMSSANNCICFPITDPLSPLHDLWARFNRCSIGYLTSLITFSCVISVFFRAPKVFVKLSALPLVFLDMMIYPFMADLNAIKLFELFRDLFRAPVFFQPIINELPFSSVCFNIEKSTTLTLENLPPWPLSK